jgi:aspartate dehydrogenase
MRVGVLGAGGIGALVGEAAAAGRLPGIELVAVAGSSPDSASARRFAEATGAAVVSAEALAESGLDAVLEAAGGAAVRSHVPRLWRAGIETVIMSIGALIDPTIEAAYREARSRGVKIHLPSGGIGGLDAVRAIAAAGEVERVSITTTKAPAGIRGAPYLLQHNITLPDDRPMTVFEGSAREAVAGFPANVNVAIALSLAGIGPDRTEVVIRSDPNARRTEQLIEVVGDVASLSVQIATNPSPSNPRTSYLAAASAIAALGQLAVH